MLSCGELERWRAVLGRLRRGAVPRGEQFDLCRRLLARFPSSPEAAGAARLLLEGAMADAATDVADAQDIIRILKALDRSEIGIEHLLSAS